MTAAPRPACAQDVTARQIVVSGAEAGEEFEDPGGYGQPEWAERSRASATTKLYVLSPFEVFFGFVSESDFLRHGSTAHDLTQEIEVGLPFRLELDLENHVGLAGGRAGESEASAGVRYAFAAWGRISLNPTISANYIFSADDAPPDRFEQARSRRHSDGYELRILLGQEFVPQWQWASNIFFQREFSGGRNQRVGFTQDVAYLALADKLELGAEMRYTHAARRERDAANEFVVGPSINWKANFYTVVSLAPLFGCTADSPRVAILATVSLEFGGGESKTAKSRAAR